jgi:subtilase family serine protease
LLLLNPWGPVSLAADRPDLVVTSVSNPPATAVPGDSFTVTATVKNQGILASPGTVTKFYLVGSVTKNLSGIQDIAPLAPAASDGPTVTIALFSDTAPGTYVLQACADDDNVVIEAVESNNCTTSATSITVLQTPDLVVTSVTDPPSSAPQGGSFTVSNTVKNAGPVTAAASITKYYLVATPGPGKKDLQGVQNVPALAPDGTFTEQETVTIRTDTLPGQYLLQACADAGKVDPEEDENNNCLTSSGPIQVTARADLVVTSVTVAGAPLTVNRKGGTLAITAAVANQGLADAPSSTMKFLLVNPVGGATKNLKGTQAVPSLVSGATANVQQTVSLYADTAPGTYTVRACVDSAKVIPETAEGNNCATTIETVTVQGTAPSNVDLVVTVLTDPPATALPGDSLPLTATVKNLGSSTSNASTTRFFLVGAVRKNLKGVQPIGPLGPGASDGPAATLEVYSDTVPGTYTLQACADGDDDNDELVETNNCANAAGSITVLEAPDLVVTSITNPPTTAEQGDGFAVQDTVKNIGPVPTVQATTTKYYLVSTTGNVRKDLKGTQTVPILTSNATFTDQQTVTIQPDTALGRYRLQACADSGKLAAEDDENNNCLTSTGVIEVTARPDLVVTSVTVEGAPTTVGRQGSLTITAVVKNQGLADARSSTMKFVLLNVPGGGTKNLKGTQAVPSLAAGATGTVQKTVTVYGDTPLGTYHVQACADSSKVVRETSESNNCGTASGTLTVTAH